MRRSFSSWDNLSVKTAAPSELFRKLPSVDDVMRAAGVNALATSNRKVRPISGFSLYEVESTLA